MTWGEFKTQVEQQGVLDSTEIYRIDIMDQNIVNVASYTSLKDSKEEEFERLVESIRIIIT